MEEYICMKCGETIEEDCKINLITEDGFIELCPTCAEIFEQELMLKKEE